MLGDQDAAARIHQGIRFMQACLVAASSERARELAGLLALNSVI